MSKNLFSSLRPYICNDCRIRLAITPIQSRPVSSSIRPSKSSTTSHKAQALDNAEVVKRRITRLGGKDVLESLYPRWAGSLGVDVLSAAEFSNQYKHAPEASWPANEITVYGRVTGRRLLGNKLLFWELSTSEDNSSLGAPAQISVNQERLTDEEPAASHKTVRELDRKVQRGDWIAVTGKLGKDKYGTCRLNATQSPSVLAPSLQEVPLTLSDEEFRMRNRHANQIVNPSSRDIVYLRSQLINGIREFLRSRNFVEVNTPLLVAGAGGAIARPFKTVATEFLDTNLTLRVAPELFLKRMIVGGMQKVFEIGPAFRNEGVDATHNPEFTICEFYSVLTSLEDLMKMTEDLFVNLSLLSETARTTLSSLRAPRIDFATPFERLEFIPSIEKAIHNFIPGWTFPDLTNPDAMSFLTGTAINLNVPIPLFPTLPRLLDAYAAHFLEPQCERPTFITHHPECMSPLAKSFLRAAGPVPTISTTTASSGSEATPNATPATTRFHRVSARAELFIGGREYVNCYEEENSPLSQRRKFEEQLTHRNRAEGDDAAETHGVVDESYVSALEWGMPPTGGWGCGVDRIVMLFGGKSRIADVLSFGNLRHVVGLGSAMREKEKEEEREREKELKKEVETTKEAVEDRQTTKAPKLQWPSAKPVVKPTQAHVGKEADVDNSSDDAVPVVQKPKKPTTQFAAPRLMSFKELIGGSGSGDGGGRSGETDRNNKSGDADVDAVLAQEENSASTNAEPSKPS